MKQFTRIAGLLMIICLLFCSPAFAGGANDDPDVSGAEEQPETGFWSRECRSHPGELVTLEDIPWKNGAYSNMVAETAARGDDEDLSAIEAMPKLNPPEEIPLLAIVVGFDNIDYVDGYNWFEQIFWTSNTGSASVGQYYWDMSGTKFTFVSVWEESQYEKDGNTNIHDRKADGIIHVRLERDHGDWYQDDAEHNIDLTKAVIAAIEAADPYVDFASLDNDGNGRITNDEMALAVIMAGYEGSYGDYPQYGAENYLWSFAWDISSAARSYNSDYNAGITVPKPDGVAVDNYIAIPESLVPGTQEPISVLAHELGHYLGLPDLYDTDYDPFEKWSAFDVGYLSVMCSGSWCWNGTEYLPGGFDAWSKCALGWVTPEPVSPGVQDYMIPNWDLGRILKIETGIEGEYYLVENRSFAEKDDVFRSGWDAVLNRKSGTENVRSFFYGDYSEYGGLILWHIDDNVYDEYAATNEVNNSFHRPAIMPLYPQVSGYGDGFRIGFSSGTLAENGLSQPFFTGDIWRERYADDAGPYLELPVYNGNDNPYEQSLSGIKVYFDPYFSSDDEWQNIVVEGVKEVERIAGRNRYSTALEAAEALKEKLNVDKFGNIVIASGEDYADALAGSYLAVIKDAPILLVNSGTVPVVAKYAAENIEEGGKVYILGGTGAIPFTMETALAIEGVGNFKRIAGRNRYATNTAILEEAMSDPKHSSESLLLCYGGDYADCLSASAVGLPVFLVNKTLTTEQKTFLQAHQDDLNYVYAIGGTAVVSDSVAFDTAYELGCFDFTRVAGANRYKTSTAVAEQFFGHYAMKVYLAYANNYPDGLAGGPLAYSEEAPMLLVTNANSGAAVSWCEETGIYYCAVMGGESLISDETALSMITK